MRGMAIGMALLLGCGAASESTTASPATTTAAPASVAAPVTTVAAPVAATDCRAATPDELAALATAEAFVRDQGYTDAPVLDPTVLVPEGMEPDDRAERLAFRHASVEPAAYGVFGHDGASPITVIFRPDRSYLARVFPADAAEQERRHAETGRALVVTAGETPHFVHQDAMLAAAQPLCPR